MQLAGEPPPSCHECINLVASSPTVLLQPAHALQQQQQELLGVLQVAAQ